MRHLWASLLLLAGTACAAPAPFPSAHRKPCRKPPPPSCLMRWGGSDYHARFYPDGAYVAAWPGNGVTWHGSWSYDPAARVLTIRESTTPAEPASYSTYRIEIRLKADWSGEVTRRDGVEISHPFRLGQEPPKQGAAPDA